MALPTQHTVRGSEGDIAQLESRVTDVHIVFKTHLDVGFTDLARNVTATYVSRFVPAVIELARTLRESASPDRFIWTTGSWLIYEYLERASGPDRARLEEAIMAGDIVWHGLPFTTHSELMDASLFEFGLSLSQQLDRRFGRQTIAAKMTDVPGHTRGIVPLLAAAGITFLHIGVNEASTPPDVPPVFVWRDPSAAEVMVMYQKGGYGGLVMVPGLSDALLVAHTDDNQGPQSAAQVAALYRTMRERFPGAQVHASTLDAFARKLLSVKSTLPVVTQEIGDTWIHGAGTDPAKVAQFRELSRLRRRWLESGRVRPDDAAMAAFSRSLLMIPEHTWGLDVKTHLADYTNYGAAQFRAVRARANFRHMEESWAEQRAYLRAAVEALGESPEGAEARRAPTGAISARGGSGPHLHICWGCGATRPSRRRTTSASGRAMSSTSARLPRGPGPIRPSRAWRQPRRNTGCGCPGWWRRSGDMTRRDIASCSTWPCPRSARPSTAARAG